MTEYDVVVVGGGVVGFTLACLLGKAGFKILVIERQAIPPGISRVSALHRASESLLQNIGVWEAIPVSQKTPYVAMQVWDDREGSPIRFDASSIGEANLGYIVENDALILQLYRHLQTFSSVDIHTPGQLRQLITASPTSNPIEVVYEYQGQQHAVYTRLVVGADGSHSSVREAAGIPLQEYSYHQTAIIANVVTEKPHAATAWQRFLPTGPLAVLPLSDPYATSIVWSAESKYAEYLMGLEDVQFCTNLSSAFEYTLGFMKTTSARKTYPLVARHAESYVKPRVALIGDAAHTIHPLAGQGLNLGLMDAKALGEILLLAKNKQKDMGAPSLLQRYEQQQRGVNLGMLLLVQGFQWLFSNDWFPAVLLRNQGLAWANNSAQFKNFLMRRALGEQTVFSKFFS